MFRHFRVPAVLSITIFTASALQPAPLFQDGAVLQRDRPVPVWGTAKPEAVVTVAFGDASVTATTGADGRWRAELPPQTTNAEGSLLKISTAENSIKIKDVLVGEVWLASGQSNMGWQIRQSRKEDQQAASAGPVPGLRLFQVPQKLSYDPLDTVDAKWVPATPETAPTLTAVGYFFGRHLVEQLGVPVGIINSSWGGSRIEPWWDEHGLDGIEELADLRKNRRARTPGFPEFRRPLRAYAEVMGKWSSEAVAAIDAGRDAPPQPEPPKRLSLGHGGETGTYQAMIHPLAPYALRGIIWYQGESNRGDGMMYFHKKRALIQGWRARFENPDAPFLFVQLAPFQYGQDDPEQLPKLWVAQQKCLEIPNTGMAVTLDIGDVKDIHPGNKSEVGRRLALWALADSYGKSDIVKSGPLYAGHGVAAGAVEIRFDHIGGGLATRDGNPPSHFEVAGADGPFHPASADISADGSSIKLSSPQVASPRQARFAWNKTAEPNLMNKEGLPAAAFHTHWPEEN